MYCGQIPKRIQLYLVLYEGYHKGAWLKMQEVTMEDMKSFSYEELRLQNIYVIN